MTPTCERLDCWTVSGTGVAFHRWEKPVLPTPNALSGPKCFMRPKQLGPLRDGRQGTSCCDAALTRQGGIKGPCYIGSIRREQLFFLYQIMHAAVRIAKPPHSGMVGIGAFQTSEGDQQTAKFLSVHKTRVFLVLQTISQGRRFGRIKAPQRAGFS